jgi:hypothetical protein
MIVGTDPRERPFVGVISTALPAQLISKSFLINEDLDPEEMI